MQSIILKMTRQWKRWLVLLAFCALLLTGALVADEPDNETGVLRSRVYKLKYITSQQAQAFFSQLNIGKSYNPLAPDVLILTSNVGSDLIRATEIIDLFDQDPPAKIHILTTDSQTLPELGTFVASLTNMTVGTMIEAPPKGSEKPAVIDIVDNQVIAIASEEVLNEINTAFQEWKKENQITASEDTVSEKSVTPEKSEAIVEPNELFQPDEKAVSSPESLQEIARQFFETQSVDDANDLTKETATELTEPAAEPNEPVDAGTQQEAAGDFLSEGLLQELADAEQTLAETDVVEITEEPQPPSTAIESAPLATDETTREKAAEDDPMKILQALMAQTKAEKEQAAAQQEAQAEPEAASLQQPVSPAEADAVLADQPAEEAEPIQTELEQLRQKLAELEARTAEATTPAPEPIAESKIQKTQTVQTEPQINPRLAEKELETIIDIPKEVELEALVELVGKQLGLNYMHDPGIFGTKGKEEKVLLKLHGGKIKVKDTYKLLQSVLRLKGYVMMRDGQLVTIVKSTDAAAMKGVDIVIRRPEDPIQPGDIIVSTIFDLEHISAASAKTMLQSMNLGLDPARGFHQLESNTLIVTDYAKRMSRIENVLKMIDVPGEKREFQYRTLQYMEPSVMVPKLQELAGQLQGVSLQISTPAASQQTRTMRTRDPKTGKMVDKKVPVPTKTQTAAKKVQPDAVFIDTDDRTNRILMTGKADQIKLVNELIDALDVPQYDLKFVREYIIQNVEAIEVVDVLNELGLVAVSVTTTPTRTTPTRTARTAQQGRAAQPQQRATSPKQGAKSQTGGSQPSISVRPAANSLLVNATAEQHKAIELVIAHVDVVQKDQRTIRQYEIQYVEAQEIIATLGELGIIVPQSTSRYDSSRSGTSRSRQQPGRSAQQQQAAEGAAPVSLPTAGGGSEKEITADQPQISVLGTTNSLLVYATPRQHDAIALVIGHTDRERTRITAPYVVYNLENQNSGELATTLNELIQETFEDVQKQSSPTDKIQRGGATTASSNIPSLQEERPKVISNEKSNSIIVYGNKRNQEWIGDLVKELDQNRFQVLLDVTLVEISKDDVFNYDLELISAIPDMTSLSGALDYTIGRSNVEDILNNLDAATDRNRFKEGTSRGGRLEGFYGNDKIMALLDLMQEKGYGRVLNRPRILVNDNEPGMITLEEVTYRKIVSNVVQGTDNPVTTENVSYQDYAAGITLEITPHISQEDRLRLEIKLNRSTFLPTTTTDTSQPPDTINSDVDSVVTVPDESTVILGGLDRITLVKGGTKVPILGDIPLIGGLFRTISNDNNQRKIYIFVKANILRPGEDNQDLKDISDKNIAVFEHYEREMQGYQDWPGIDSDPIEPRRILREEEDIINKLDEETQAM
ncbi:MAG: secretin N-terminal domain-containing protein [Planctomycetota bacterium]